MSILSKHGKISPQMAQKIQVSDTVVLFILGRNEVFMICTHIQYGWQVTSSLDRSGLERCHLLTFKIFKKT